MADSATTSDYDRVNGSAKIWKGDPTHPPTYRSDSPAVSQPAAVATGHNKGHLAVEQAVLG